jgi:predicted DNA-binding protein YlxM (UPF0122 family)
MIRKKYADKRTMPANTKNPVRCTTGSAAIKHALKKRQILAMRLRNMTLTEIAEKLNVTPQAIQQTLREAIDEIPKESAEQLKFIINDTLQKLINRNRPLAMLGDKTSSNTLIKSIDKLMKLEGLEATTKNEIEVNNIKTVVGEGIDVTELDLPIEVQKQILEAMRKRSKEIEEKNNGGNKASDISD